MIVKQRRNYEKRPADARPVPESVAHSGGWTTLKAEGQVSQVDLDDQRITLPLDGSETSQSLRNQAYTALAIDREAKFPRLSEFASTEEQSVWGNLLKTVYLDEYAQARAVDLEHLPIPLDHPSTEAKRAMRYIELASLGERGRDAWENLLKEMEHPEVLIDACATTISRLAQLGKDSKKINPAALQEIIQKLMQLFPAEAGEQFHQRPVGGSAESTADGDGRPPEMTPADHGWGAMETLELPRGLKHDTARVKRKPRASLVGAFKLPHRANLMISDGRCFVLRKKKEGGGAVLIDLSGSMEWKESEISELLDHAPMAVVAGYGSHPKTRLRGRLGIIARDGTIGDAQTLRASIGLENVVDGPALKWLAEQPEPRIWVSDGSVTGAGARRTQSLIEEAFQIVKSNHIQQVDDLGAALTVFQRYKENKKRRKRG